MTATPAPAIESTARSAPLARAAPARRFYEIDLLRFLAAFSVMLFHYSFRGHAADGITSLSYPAIAPVTRYGFLGVNLFFLISGFVILMSAGGGSPRQFVVSRIVRLYPAFWVCCTVTFLAMRIAPHPRLVPSVGQYAANMTMLGGFFDVAYVDNVYWSLVVEMKFYVMVYAVLALGQIHHAKQLLGIWLLLYVATVAFHIRHLPALLIPEYAPYFIAGAMFFLIAKEGASVYKLAVIAVSYATAVWQIRPVLATAGEHYHTRYSSVAVAVTLAAFYVVFFLVAAGYTRALATKKWLALGALTYPLYLLHQNIGFAIFNSAHSRVSAHVVMWGVVALMMLLAHLVTRIERRSAGPLKQLLLGERAPTTAR
jgi:peptidoglycan/LPS O-acetylase OafA/YrhL